MLSKQIKGIPEKKKKTLKQHQNDLVTWLLRVQGFCPNYSDLCLLSRDFSGTEVCPPPPPPALTQSNLLTWSPVLHQLCLFTFHNQWVMTGVGFAYVLHKRRRKLRESKSQQHGPSRDGGKSKTSVHPR